MKKYIFVTGGVLSSVGKGVIAASIGKILQARGYNVDIIKIDPYLNVDSGTMNPYVHGEVFVTEDGSETDLDIGHYERFLNKDLTKDHNITTGQVYLEVITKERRGDFLGECVQIIPHVTDEIKRRIRKVAYSSNTDIIVVEIGGTVGDIESLPFLEAGRQMKLEEPLNNVIFVHVALVPTLSVTGEQKTKPLQHSVNELRRIGIQPEIIVARSIKPISPEIRKKIALFGNVREEFVFNSYDVENIYKMPLILEEQGIGELLVRLLNLQRNELKWNEWKQLMDNADNPKYTVSVAMIGKYLKLKDSYVSINEALRIAGFWLRTKVNQVWIDAEELEKKESTKLIDEILSCDGAILLPGFGKRGAEGKILAAQIIRENKMPMLGICFGFQLAIVEFARNVCKLEGANSTEVDPYTKYSVIDLLPEQKNIEAKGGTMRLGAYEIRIVKGTLAYEIYKQEVIKERHRHRYEINPKFYDILQEKGLIFSGFSLDNLVEIAEIKDHFYFLTQAHPEFKARVLNPSPPYYAFINYLIENRINRRK
jgi:CTP synthase